MKRSASEDSISSNKKSRLEIEYAVDKNGSIRSLSTNSGLICFLCQNRSNLILSHPHYSGMKDIKIINGRYLYGLCTIGIGKPYLYKYLDTHTNITFALDKSKLEDYAEKVELNKWLALATHPLVLQYIRSVKPKDIKLVYTAKSKIYCFTSDGVTINIIIEKGDKFLQLN
uniref:Uncharacterized protein n=1 Tax=Pithovirus LCPAC401 TaxID=2506595 RepID=A0A481ZB46_9VIRU|nr:MAG: hypothetical protein LCPAC401_00080 [Pithovirus LCPAC401]